MEKIAAGTKGFPDKSVRADAADKEGPGGQSLLV